MAPTDRGVTPPNEAERLDAVRRYAILDTPPDGSLDRAARLAARIFQVPIAVVSIVDHGRIWFKARHGIDLEQTDREPGLCASAIPQAEPWVVADASVDPRTPDNALVRKLGLRFYAGAPLKTGDGHNLGALAVIDTERRAVTDDELSTLSDLAAIVVDELEARRSARDDKQRLARARADFVATASHELRTPLAAVYGAAKLLEQAHLRSDEERKTLLAVIAEESERLAAIVDEILTGAQLDDGRVQLVLGRCLPLLIAQRAVEAARAHLPDNLSLQLSADRDLPEIESDAGRIRQILAGLLDNAAKYSPGGGRIEVIVQARENGIRFRVTDQGIGIPPAEAQRIFERSVRLDADQARGVAGSGLGLYIARGLARQLGGWVDHEPGPDGGSSFVLDLPLGPPSPAPLAEAPGSGSQR